MTVTSDSANASQVQRDDRTALEQAVPAGSCGCPGASLVQLPVLCFGSRQNCSSLGLKHSFTKLL